MTFPAVRMYCTSKFSHLNILFSSYLGYNQEKNIVFIHLYV